MFASKGVEHGRLPISPGMNWKAPKLQIHGIIETAIYVEDLDESEAFYRTVMGLTASAKVPGRYEFSPRSVEQYAAGFRRRYHAHWRSFAVPRSKGPGHFALGIDTDALDAWRLKLQENGVAIEQEVEWPRGGKSICFRDPAENSVELITHGVWGLPSGG